LSSKICPDNFVTQKISRHYLTVNGRLVHYRRCGSGPPLIMVHQSPRSSGEYEALMREWSAHFTCIAPDTAGFGQSAPLAKADPDINDYADALVEFIHALGIERTAAYGFHSGGIILVTALKRYPELFAGLAVGGYAIWTPEEMAIFGDKYLPPFVPSEYGEHLTWLWNRILEQSWFFPWFDVREAARLPGAHDDPARVHAVVMEMLDAGDAYRLGYGAVLRAPRDIPPADAVTCPVLISAYDGDPLQAHIDRLGAMPEGWSAQKVATPKAHQDQSLAFLQQHVGPAVETFAEDSDQGFVAIKTDHFDGLIHWRGVRDSGCQLLIHAPGREMDDSAPIGRILIDMPGHGLSDDWPGAVPVSADTWRAVTDSAAESAGASETMYRLLPKGNPDQLFPDLTPDRHGHYLTIAWSIVRAANFFSPWYRAEAASAVAFEAKNITSQALAKEHRALLRARAAREMMIAYSKGA
jgi:haloalkane dehalogenase